MLARHVFRLVLTFAVVALPITAGAKEIAGSEGRTILVTGDAGETVSVSLQDGELTVVSEEDGKTSVRIVDMEQIGTLVAEGLSGALEALRDMQLEFHMGADNRVAFSHDHETIEVDINAILAEVHTALAEGFADFDDEVWVDTRDRDRTEEDLRRELRALKQEMRELRREMERISR